MLILFKIIVAFKIATFLIKVIRYFNYADSFRD